MDAYLTLHELHHRQTLHRREAEIRRLARLARCTTAPKRRDGWWPWT